MKNICATCERKELWRDLKKVISIYVLKHPRLTSPGNFFYQYVNDMRFLQIFVQILSFPKVYSQICLRQELEENCCFSTNLFIFAKMFTKSKRGR
jgi:hypothetical protein